MKLLSNLSSLDNVLDGTTRKLPTKVSQLTNDSKYITASSNVATATKLQTGRKIGLGSGAIGTATLFDGSKDITIPVTSVREAYLEWGGRNISGSISPLDAALSSVHSANRFAYAQPGGIVIEYSRNNGSTWTTYETTDILKKQLVSNIGATYYVGGRSTGGTAQDKLRITLTASAMGVYARLRKILVNVTTNGCTGSHVVVEYATIGAPTVFKQYGDYGVAGWSGWNSLPVNTTFGGSTSQTSQVASLRFTFGVTAVPSSGNTLGVIDIAGFGDTYWNYPSNMAKSGHLYAYDASQNAVFPAKVTATSFVGPLSGNANTATKLQTARNITIGKTKKTFDGSADLTWTASDIGTNVYVGTTQPTDSNIEVWVNPEGTIDLTEIWKSVYPVGSIYMSVNSTNPGTLFGGTWVQLKDRFLLGAGSTYTNGKTGGYTATQKHTHSIPALSGTAANAGSHSHRVTNKTSSYAGGKQDAWRCMSFDATNADWYQDVYSSDAGAHTHDVTVNASGTAATKEFGTGAIASAIDGNMPPYLVVYMWKRTA